MRTRTSSGPTSRVVVASTIFPALEPLKTVNEGIFSDVPKVSDNGAEKFQKRRFMLDAGNGLRCEGREAHEGSKTLYMRIPWQPTRQANRDEQEGRA